MAEKTEIAWCDATGRRLGAYKSAAKKCGCTVSEWIAHRTAGRRRCFRCKEWKPFEQFSKDSTRGDGRTCSCRECSSDASTASRYGLSVQELKAFREKHEHRCGICSATDILYVDHDHATGRLRGLLCPGCNSAIGVFKEDPALFASALAYLERHDG